MAALHAGELYPTAVRTSAHGFSAGTAKMGALWAAVWFNYLDNRHKFWLTASFNIGGFLLTLLFMPDPLRVSLAEVDRRWNYLRTGRVYHGEAVKPGNLSLFERFIGVGKVGLRACIAPLPIRLPACSTCDMRDWMALVAPACAARILPGMGRLQLHIESPFPCSLFNFPWSHQRVLHLQNFDKAKDEEDRWQETMAVNGGGKEKPGLEMGNGNNGAVV
ncbi:hypothetical protein MMC29_006283 [Sticta canariensis]|nr:hypothetical protein [Sticta canariensis]